MTIPIIGESYQRISFVPLQTIICKCTPGMLRFLMMFGVGNRVECGGCGRYYHIGGMMVDGTCNIVVEVPTPPTPPELVQ